MKKLWQNTLFKCVTVLLLICVVAGGILAVLNDVLYVSPAERTGRAIKSIYGTDMDYAVILDIDDADESKNSAIEYECTGRIEKIYSVQDGDSADLLFKTVGYGGYKNGTLITWIKVSDINGKWSVEKVILESFTKQTLMSKLGDGFYSRFTELKDVTEAYLSGELFTSTNASSDMYNPVTGATRSANAGCNAVNCVILYLGGER